MTMQADWRDCRRGNITNSYATGEVNGGAGGDQVGGLVGRQNAGTITNNSYAAGDVDGGLVLTKQADWWDGSRGEI